MSETTLNSFLVPVNSDTFKKTPSGNNYYYSCNNYDDNEKSLYFIIEGTGVISSNFQYISGDSDNQISLNDCLTKSISYDLIYYSDSSYCIAVNFPEISNIYFKCGDTSINDCSYSYLNSFVQSADPPYSNIQATDYTSYITDRGYNKLKNNNFNNLREFSNFNCISKKLVDNIDRVTYSIDSCFNKLSDGLTSLTDINRDISTYFTNFLDKNIIDYYDTSNTLPNNVMGKTDITSHNDLSLVATIENEINMQNKKNNFTAMKLMNKYSIYIYLLIIFIITFVLILLNFLVPNIITIEILIGYIIFIMLITFIGQQVLKIPIKNILK